MDYNLDNWASLLPTAEFAYNNAPHESTKESPFFVEYGRNPRAGPTLIKESKIEDLNDLICQRQEAQEQAKAALSLVAERMKWYYDQKRQEVTFKVGDLVYLELKDYEMDARKLQAKRTGPFEIIEQINPVTFKLKLPSKFRAIHLVFHASKLSPHTESSFPGQRKKPPAPIIRQGKEE